jgi:hypothetical protein
VTEPGYQLDAALVQVVHMYQTLTAQTDALIRLNTFAAEIRATLTESGLFKAHVEALRVVMNECDQAQTTGAAYQGRIEKLQHALEQIVLLSSQ